MFSLRKFFPTPDASRADEKIDKMRKDVRKKIDKILDKQEAIKQIVYDGNITKDIAEAMNIKL